MLWISFFKSHWKSLVLFGLLVSVGSFYALMLTSKQYKAQTDFLIVQNQSTQDFYSLSRSNEYLSSVMGEALYSELFINEALASNVFPKNLFPENREDRMDAWKEMVRVDRNLQKNILTVAVYGNSSADVLNVSKAVGDVFINKNILFRSGSPEMMDMRIISGPIVKRNPNMSEVVLTAIAGFAFGILIGVLWSVWYDTRRSNAVIQFHE